MTDSSDFGRVYSVELNKYMTTISLHDALKAIQEFVDTRLPEGTQGLVIRVDNSWCSPEVASYFSLSMLQSLGSLRFTSNPDWKEGKNESRFARQSVTEQDSVPFYQRYKVGDKFRIVSLTPSVLMAGYNDEVKVGDTFEIVSLHGYDPDQPYFVTGAHTDCHPFAHTFLAALEAGAVVLEEEVPFHQKYKEGDKFRVAKDLPSDYQRRFSRAVACGDVLVITNTDPEDETMPYKVAPELKKSDYTWGRQFKQLVESGVLVYQSDEPKPVESYDTIVLGGVTYNLVPQ